MAQCNKSGLLLVYDMWNNWLQLKNSNVIEDDGFNHIFHGGIRPNVGFLRETSNTIWQWFEWTNV